MRCSLIDSSILARFTSFSASSAAFCASRSAIAAWIRESSLETFCCIWAINLSWITCSSACLSLHHNKTNVTGICMSLAPPYLAADCVPVTSLPSWRHLRSAESGCLAVTGTMTNLGSRNFAVAGAKVWNSLPVDLRLLSRSLRTFGHKLKHYLFVSEPWAHLSFFKFALYKFSHYYYYYSRFPLSCSH